jgi:hypothetical protein
MRMGRGKGGSEKIEKKMGRKPEYDKIMDLKIK